MTRPGGAEVQNLYGLYITTEVLTLICGLLMVFVVAAARSLHRPLSAHTRQHAPLKHAAQKAVRFLFRMRVSDGRGVRVGQHDEDDCKSLVC